MLILKYNIKKMTYMKLNEYKNHIIKLVETRGVAAAKDENCIELLLDYIETKVRNLGQNYGKEIEFNVPYKILSEFTFLGKPEIIVTNTDITKHGVVIPNGTGSCTVDTKHITLIGGKLYGVVIKIHTYSVMNQLVDRTFLNVIYHELNHAYDAFKNAEVKGNMFRYTYDVQRQNWTDNIDLNEYWKELFYRYFSNTEFNALVASVYGDLKSMKSERKNFHNDYKKTFAYTSYSFYTSTIRNVLKRMKNNELFIIINRMKNNGIPCRINTNDENEVRRYLLKYVLNKCAKLLRGIGRVASLYYDREEDKEGYKIINCDYDNGIYDRQDLF